MALANSVVPGHKVESDAHSARQAQNPACRFPAHMDDPERIAFELGFPRANEANWLERQFRYDQEASKRVRVISNALIEDSNAALL